jgi:diguanylate cyclase (GGDEF)-like protein
MMNGMMDSGAIYEKPAPRLAALAEAALAHSGFRLAFPAALEARYLADIAVERLREVRFIAFWGLATYVCLGVVLNLTIIEGADWKDVALQLLGSGLLVFAIIQCGLHERRAFATREFALLVGCLICSLSAIMAASAKPSPVTLRDFLLGIPPCSFVLIFVRLRFHQAIAFFLVNVSVFSLAVFSRPEISRSDGLFLIGFMTTLLLPALLGSHAYERASRRLYLHRLLERLRNESLAAQNATLTGLSYTDPLTGIANRRQLDASIAEFLSAPGRTGALLLVDIDLFKGFNDRYGHLAGDACLCHVSRCLASHLRRVDLIARFGGEEFAVLLPQSEAAAALQMAETLREAVQNFQFTVKDQQVHVTVSIGVAMRADRDTPQALIGAADTALYAAKHAGRNAVRVAGA